jgi:fumarate hydratase class II
VLEYLKRGVYVEIIFQCEQERLTRMKKRYFAMVTELGRHLGYNSGIDKEIFKEQVKEHLKQKSIADIDTEEEMHDVLEDLHRVAWDHYNYQFKPDGDSGIVQFHTGPDEK